MCLYRRSFAVVMSAAVLFVACASEKSEWEKAQKANNSEVYHAFLQMYPEGQHAQQAVAKIEELAFKVAETAGTVLAFEDFLQKHPQGTHHTEAEHRLAELRFSAAETINTLEGYAEFLQRYPLGDLAAKARTRRQELRFHLRAQVEGIEETTLGMGSPWEIKDTTTHTGVVLSVKFEPAGKPLPINTGHLVLAYSVGSQKQRTSCLGANITGEIWVQNDVAKGRFMELQPAWFEKVSSQTQSFLFVIPKDATDLVLVLQEEPLNEPLKGAEIPPKSE